ncbi:MAG: alpha-L-rhamnosidase N-terminal domain-containing protein [Oscillospiraceae bacterium]|nr:alpha-L-rhamnosidase N-terminal domain-containing protein [Oscillospiraceae bacterium]
MDVTAKTEPARNALPKIPTVIACIIAPEDFECCLAPGSTDYRKRLQYQTYDVTAYIRDINKLKIGLADGWYRGSIGCFGPTNVFGRQTKLLCQMEIAYTDGTKVVISCDDSFAWSCDGPIRFADLKDGEVIDASCIPSYGGRAKVVSEKITPSASNNVFPKEHEVFEARLITTSKGDTVLDFGQNMAGFVAHIRSYGLDENLEIVQAAQPTWI